MSATTTAATPGATNPGQGIGSAQTTQGISVAALLTAIGTGIIASAVQIAIFLLLRNKLSRIFIPKTYLVPERQRTTPPPRSPWGWLFSIFKYKDTEIISKCGLDAYFFLRYLQTLLIIFVPLACLLLPILLPINYVGGKFQSLQFPNNPQVTDRWNVTGLDTVAFGNVSPYHTHRYWAHLILAVVVVVWVCYIFFAELRVYIRVRQDYLTSAEHRLRASATTVLVNSIPEKWLTVQALNGLFDVFPGGIRNIWINRKYDELLGKVRAREAIVAKLEAAETKLIRKCKKTQLKKLKAEEKAAGKSGASKSLTKEEKEQRAKELDNEAKRRSQGAGLSIGDPHQVHHTVEEAVEEEHTRGREETKTANGVSKIPVVGGGLAAVGKGFGQGFDIVGSGFGKAGQNVVKGARGVGKDIDGQLGRTNGFTAMDASPRQERDAQLSFAGLSRQASSPKLQRSAGEDEMHTGERNQPTHENTQFGQSLDMSSPGLDHPEHNRDDSRSSLRNVPYQYGGDDTADVNEASNSWWKFWRGPSGGFPSPTPYGYEGDEFPLTRRWTGGGNIDQVDGIAAAPHQGGMGIRADRFWSWVPYRLFGLGRAKKSEPPPTDYGETYNIDYKEDTEEIAKWREWLQDKDRPMHRLPSKSPLLPKWFNKKVDTIYWCREHLARLNVEIHADQQHPEQYPLMNSAFIQFNHQVAAHMAAQAVIHHIPKHMAPRQVEISPSDVIWDNMSVKWWEAWLRTALILAIVAGMVVLWAIPVSGTALLGNIPNLIAQYPWLGFLSANEAALKAVSGVLPALVLALLMILPPIIFYQLATMQGAQTGNEREGSVQNYYFFFLFVQVFLVVSIASGTFQALSSNVTEQLVDIPQLLATNLPKAANYFFSYMIIQALATSAGNLLQLFPLILWFVLPKLVDNTARQKWRRNTTLQTVSWGSYFPTYTNFACIALVYCVIAPVITIFAIITFTLLWIANRYSMLYVYKHTEDTGGLVYPRAINQTFTGIYIMEVVMVGLFFLVRDNTGSASCIPHAVIMIVVAVFTAVYQVLLNQAFSPLFKHLPITLEDDAVLRDEAFERALTARYEADDGDLDDTADGAPAERRASVDIELKKLPRQDNVPTEGPAFARFDPRKATNWAARGTRNLANATFGRGDNIDTENTLRRRNRRHKDLEAQKRIGDALFGGYSDEIEDLSPEQRDDLVRAAFRHAALRARVPVVWLPRDDLGVSDDEVRRAELYGGGRIWISNAGTALDSKVRVVYGRNPPDFAEVDLIQL